jgi:hypothetical protein
MELKAKVMGAKSYLSAALVSIKHSPNVMPDLEVAYLGMPPTLAKNLENFYLLGETIASPILQAVSIGQQYDRMVADWQNDIRESRPRSMSPLAGCQHLLKHLEHVEVLVAEGEMAIEPLHDGTSAPT